MGQNAFERRAQKGLDKNCRGKPTETRQQLANWTLRLPGKPEGKLAFHAEGCDNTYLGCSHNLYTIGTWVCPSLGALKSNPVAFGDGLKIPNSLG